MIQSAPETQPLMRILLAEDEKKVAQHIRTALREQGFTVDMFHRGDEALEAALATPYDALVLDVMMPGRDGLSILRVLREKRVVLSASSAHSVLSQPSLVHATHWPPCCLPIDKTLSCSTSR